MNTEPTDEQINRGIAEWMGWYVAQDDERANNYFLCNPLKIATSEYLTEAGAWLYCPSYTTSHDACHQALERMTDDQLDDYSYELYKLVNRDGSILNVNALIIKATAHQKALAIYRVVKGVS